jgi:hypothetical protein
VKYELGFYIPADAIFRSHCRENLKSYIPPTFSSWPEAVLAENPGTQTAQAFIIVNICIMDYFEKSNDRFGVRVNALFTHIMELRIKVDRIRNISYNILVSFHAFL